MAEKSSPKGQLPYGWSVHVSTRYPNKVFYFNNVTGDTTWECPKLDPPRIVSEDISKNINDIPQKDNEDLSTNNVFEACSPVVSDDCSEKSATPPTAIVTPVVQKSKRVSFTCDDSPTGAQEKKIKLKRKSDYLLENSVDSESCNKLPSVKKKKHVSPLNKSPTELTPNELIDGIRSPLVEKMCEDEMNNSTLESASESTVSDVEMRDVSVDLLDDLTEKNETVFDTTACYYIVVDTNVLVRELDLINELKDTPLDGCGPPHIFIPWVVIEELDKLKSQRLPKVGPGASEAIRFLNSVLGKHPRFHGQSPAEAEAWAKTYSKCNDDKILECCMGLADRMPAEKVILLTNDKNLVNKAIICKINVHNFESMIQKVKPDTKFNCEEMKSAKKKKKEKEAELSKSSNESRITVEERMLHSKRDNCKREIHSIMSNARYLLKEVLHQFLSEEMLEAYGSIWVNFPIDTKLLKGVLGGILKYWRAVFYEFLTEKDKRNLELLLEKASRPEGFMGENKDECLVILSTIEDVFRQIEQRRPNLKVPVEEIQEYRVACVNAFIVFCDAESQFRVAEDKSICELLDDNWTVINKMCGIILDHYEIPHNFDYYGKENQYPETEVQHLMVTVYPAVRNIKKLLCDINEAVKKCQPVKKTVKRLASALLEFVPSVSLFVEPKTYPFFNGGALEKWFTSPQNRQKIEIGLMQIETFFSKLEEALQVMLRPKAS